MDSKRRTTWTFFSRVTAGFTTSKTEILHIFMEQRDWMGYVCVYIYICMYVYIYKITYVTVCVYIYIYL